MQISITITAFLVSCFKHPLARNMLSIYRTDEPRSGEAKQNKHHCAPVLQPTTSHNRKTAEDRLRVEQPCGATPGVTAGGALALVGKAAGTRKTSSLKAAAAAADGSSSSSKHLLHESRRRLRIIKERKPAELDRSEQQIALISRGLYGVPSSVGGGAGPGEGPSGRTPFISTDRRKAAIM